MINTAANFENLRANSSNLPVLCFIQLVNGDDIATLEDFYSNLQES